MNPAQDYLNSLPKEAKNDGETVLKESARLLSDSLDWRSIDWFNLLNPRIIESKIISKIDRPLTKLKFLTVLKGVAKHAAIDQNIYQGIKVAAPSGQFHRFGRELTKREIQKVIKTARLDTSKKGVRNLALISFLISTGAKIGELHKLKVNHIQIVGNITYAKIGSGASERTLQLDGVHKALSRWMEIRGSEEGALFCRIKRWGFIRPTLTITTTAISQTISKLGKDAGIDPLTCHDFRKTIILNLIQNKVSIKVIAEKLGVLPLQILTYLE